MLFSAATILLKRDTTCPTCWSNNQWVALQNTSLLKYTSNPRAKKGCTSSLKDLGLSKAGTVLILESQSPLKSVKTVMKAQMIKLPHQRKRMLMHLSLRSLVSSIMPLMMPKDVPRSRLWNNMFQRPLSSTRTLKNSSLTFR